MIPGTLPLFSRETHFDLVDVCNAQDHFMFVPDRGEGSVSKARSSGNPASIDLATIVYSALFFVRFPCALWLTEAGVLFLLRWTGSDGECEGFEGGWKGVSLNP